MFELITPLSYWVLTILWLVILWLYLSKLRQSAAVGGAVAVLLSILAIDAFRTVFESVYFGLYFNSMFGLLPMNIYDVLAQPELIIIPKLVNVVAGFLVLFLLIRRWLPREIRLREEWIQSLQDARYSAEEKREEAEQQLSKFESIFNGISDGIVFADTDRRIISANRGMKKIFGYTLDDLGGKKTSLLYESEEEYKRQGRIRFNLSAEEQSEPYEVNYRRKDGGIFVGETLGAAIKGAEGEVRGYIGVIRDITERKKLELSLKEANQLNETIIANSPIGIATYDSTGHCCSADDSFSRIIGATHEQALSQNYHEIESWKKAGLYDKMLECLSTNELVRHDLHVVSSFGKDIYLDCHLSTIKVKGEKHLLLMINDITERKQMEVALLQAKEEAERLNHAKSEFLASMSHDLRTPLNAIVGFSDMMRQQAFGPIGNTNYEDYADAIHDSGSLLISLINDVLDLSKIESGNYELVEEPISISALINVSIRQLTAIAESSNVTLINDIPSDFPHMTGDARVLIQMFNNLVSNAIKFTPNAGIVNIFAVLGQDNAITVKVNDTGIGMSEAGVAKALKPFEHADSMIPHKHGGTGLGLHLCVNFMKLFGGNLDIDSGIEKGTTVSLHFPPERTITET